jgi:DNA-binding CsgD family transcriptional regulator
MRWEFVGRVSELAVLTRAWRTAEDGGVAPVLVVYGEAGIGKTRTVAEFASAVRERGGEVLWGSCYEGGDAHPYAVWSEAIREWVERIGPEGLRSAVGPEARWLAPLLPDIRGIRMGVPAEVARVRLAEVLAGALGSFERPPVLVLDDMQWAYPDSLELFVQTARLATGAVMVLCCRGTALELGHPLAQRLAEVHRQRACEYLPLTSLSRPDAGELLEQAAGEPLEPALVDAVYSESGGNAFFLRELGRHLHRHGGSVLAADGELKLPESIRGAVGLRLANMGAQTRHVLQLASVFTAGFGFSELQALTELDDGQLLECLDQALAEELIRPLDGERYDFTHALVRHTLYERLSPSRRARLHRRLAEALERLHEGDLGQVAWELVRQYHASATLPGADRGARHALAGARQARAAGAPRDAVVLLRLGLDLVDAEATGSRGEMLGELAVAEAESGVFDDATEKLEDAVALLERGGASGETIAALVYQVGATFASVVSLRHVQAMRPLIARALAALGQTRSLVWARLKVLDGFDQPEAFGPLRVVRPVRFDPEAVRVVRSEGTEADYALTIDGWDQSFGVEVKQLTTRIELWRDPVARLRVLSSIVGHVTLADPDSSPLTERLCAQLEVLANDVGLPPQRELARIYRAGLLGARGQFEAAAEQLDQTPAVQEGQPGSGERRRLVTIVRGLTEQHVSPDWPRLAADMWELARSPEKSGWLSLTFAAFSAQAYAVAGDSDRARDILVTILPALESDALLGAATSNPLGLAGGAVWELRAQDLAEQLLPHALELADSDRRGGYMTCKELTVARLSSVIGRFDQAIDYFARAREVLDRRDQRVLRAIVDFDEALARIANKQPGAERLLSLASARFEQLGMREWSRRVARLSAGDRGLPDRLTGREAEILRAIALGKTNKEIATEFVISVHTVERHVQNAYRKIDARNRAEASTYVARVQL